MAIATVHRRNHFGSRRRRRSMPRSGRRRKADGSWSLRGSRGRRLGGRRVFQRLGGKSKTTTTLRKRPDNFIGYFHFFRRATGQQRRIYTRKNFMQRQADQLVVQVPTRIHEDAGGQLTQLAKRNLDRPKGQLADHHFGLQQNCPVRWQGSHQFRPQFKR